MGWAKETLNGNAKGQSIIEFCLALPLLIILVGGLTDFGLAFFVSIGLQNAVREGARIAATTKNLAASDTTVRDAVLAEIPAIGSFTSLSVSNTVPSSANCTAEVTVAATGNYNFSFLTYIGFTSISLSRSTTMRYQDRPLC